VSSISFVRFDSKVMKSSVGLAGSTLSLCSTAGQ
jgi:hypothetical protein